MLARLLCNGHSLLLNSLSVELRILYAASAAVRPRTLLISFCPVRLRTLSTARSLVTLCLFTACGQGPGEFPTSGAKWSPAMPPLLKRVEQHQQQRLNQEPTNLLVPRMVTRKIFFAISIIFCVWIQFCIALNIILCTEIQIYIYLQQ